MCWHKWSEWKQYKKEFTHIFPDSNTQYAAIQLRQSRMCKKCKKVEDEKVTDVGDIFNAEEYQWRK